MLRRGGDISLTTAFAGTEKNRLCAMALIAQADAELILGLVKAGAYDD
jgi:hypothetical protein